ncbi:MAG: hypothetical protein IIC07_01740, partial [Proteobacteria bacterium]|nr:hypothetical protein [Pseudomonadota bacterium]
MLDEMMPNSPGAKVLDMHDFVVGQYMRIFMKEDQAAEVWTYEGSAEEDARRIKHAFDGEFVRVDNINAVQRILKGGTNPQSLGTAMHARHLFDEFTGNVRRSGGVAASADTATEARIDSANTSRLIRDMQLQVIAATKKIYQIIAWYEWTHPKRRRQVEVKMGENGRAVTELWSPEIRDGDFVQFEIDVEPDSFEHRSSRQQLEELMKAVQGIVIPLTQMPMSRPIRIKGPELLDEYSKLANLPQLERIADYAPDDSFVSQPSGGGGSRVPAGATSGGKQ